MLKERRRCALLFPGGRRRSKNSARGSSEHDVKGEDESDTVAVLRVKLHCPACVTEVTRSLQRLHEVKEVSGDAETEMITVKGCKLEAKRLCDAVHRKTGKRCEVLLLTSMEGLLQALATTNNNNTDVVNVQPDQQQPYYLQADGAPLIIQQPDQQINTSGAAAVAEEHQGILSSTAPAPAPADDQQQQQQQLFSMNSMQHVDASAEPRIEIKQQTHTVIYGPWPSSGQYLASNYPNNVSPTMQETAPLLYQDWLSEENPNACKVM